MPPPPVPTATLPVIFANIATGNPGLLALDAAGNVVFANSGLQDGNAAVYLSIPDRYLGDEVGNPVIIFSNTNGRLMLDSRQFNALDFQNRTLLASDGTTVQLDWTIPGAIKHPVTTIAELPTIPVAGHCAIVSDALAPVWGAPLVGGGSAQALIIHNGTNWIIH